MEVWPGITPFAAPVLVLLVLLAAAGSSVRRIPPGRVAVVGRRGRHTCRREGLTVIIPELDRVTWLDLEVRQPIVLPHRRTTDGVTVALTASADLAVADPVLAVEEAGDPVLAARHLLERLLGAQAASVTLPELAELIGTELTGLRGDATFVTREYGLEVRGVRFEELDLPRLDEVIDWGQP